MKYVFKKRRYKYLITILDGLGSVLFWFLKNKRRNVSKTPGSVLVIRLDHIGDVLLSAAVPKALKENFPGCRVIFLTASWSAPLLESNPFIDEVIQFDAPWFSKLRYKRNPKTKRLWGLLQVLRERKIDLALGLRGDLRENFLMVLAGIKERVGYGITGGGFFLTKEVTYNHSAHESEHQKDLLKALGIKADALKPEIYLSKHESVNFEKRLERFGLAGDRKFICLLLGAGAPSKDWPVKHMDAFIDLFLSHFQNYKIVLVGSSQRIMGQLTAKSGERVLNLVGETSLRELCLLAKKAKFFVGADSGPTHISAVLGTPTLFLFSGTNAYERWKPLAASAIVLRHAVPCSPCESEICPIEGHPCMAEIRPEEALNILDSQLSR